MRMWISVAAVGPLMMAAAAQAQALKTFSKWKIPAAERQQSLDLRLAREQWNDPSSPLAGGLLVQQSISAGTFLGVGLADMYGRKKRSLRSADGPVRSRRPAVSFVMKF